MGESTGPSKLKDRVETLRAKAEWHRVQAANIETQIRETHQQCTHRYDDGKSAMKDMWLMDVCDICGADNG